TPPSNPPYGYRRDPAHANRALFTTRGYDLDRVKVAPNFVDRSLVNGLAMENRAGYSPTRPGVVLGSTYPAAPYVRGAISDFAADAAPGAQRMVNAMAVLGSVDLNRPLAD